MTWRNDPMTEKQKTLISELQEMSEFPLPKFTGTTKGEASDWLDENIGKAHECMDRYEMSH